MRHGNGLRRSDPRFRHRPPAAKPDVLPDRRRVRKHGRRFAGHGGVVGDLDPAAAHLWHAAGRSDPDARRHRLRRPVWRRDLLDPLEPALSSAARRNLSRRLSVDEARQGRNGARHHHHGRGLRRRLRHPSDDFHRALYRADRVPVHLGRNLLAHAAGTPRRIDPCQGLAPERRGDDHPRLAPWPCRPGHQYRGRAFHLRHPRSRRRGRAGRALARAVRHRGVPQNREQHRADRPHLCEARRQRPAAKQGRHEEGGLPHLARNADRQLVLDDPRHWTDDRILRCLRRREEDIEGARTLRPRRHRGRTRRRNPRPIPRFRAISFRP